MFMLVPYLGLGQLYRNKYELINNRLSLRNVAISYIAIWTLCICLFRTVPGITGVVNCSLFQLPFLVLLSIIGSLLILQFTEYICRNRELKVFEYIGQNTLVIYCLHFVTLDRIMVIYKPLFDIHSLHISFVAYCGVLLSISIICVLYVSLFNTKYLKFIVGKW